MKNGKALLALSCATLTCVHQACQTLARLVNKNHVLVWYFNLCLENWYYNSKDAERLNEASKFPSRNVMVGKTIVVVGGGIAGICCLEAIINEQCVDDTLILITDSRIIKRVRNFDTPYKLETCDVLTEDIRSLLDSRTRDLDLKLIVGTVQTLDVSKKVILYHTYDSESEDWQKLEQPYDLLCLCHGAKPIQLHYSQKGSNLEVDRRVIVLRDTDTVDDFRKKLQDCRRLVLVGNGGISLELAYRVSNCEKTWIVRDETIGCNFFDSGAAKFLLDSISADQTRSEKTKISYSTTKAELASTKFNYGPALGPNWSQNFELVGNDLSSHKLDIFYKDQVSEIVHRANTEYPLQVLTRKKKEIDCDLVVTGIGVEANHIPIIGSNLETSSSNGGILIDEQMRTSINGIYAAGDVVSCERWTHREHWLQMRLWTQARQMGYYAGKCLVNHLRSQDPTVYFQFDCFAHSTSFFGYKLILLGRYNGQACDSGDNLDVIVRVDPGKEYLKVIIKDDKIYGAVLVGDTGKEDMLENMILDGLHVDEAVRDSLLNDTIEIDDWYD